MRSKAGINVEGAMKEEASLDTPRRHAPDPPADRPSVNGHTMNGHTIYRVDGDGDGDRSAPERAGPPARAVILAGGLGMRLRPYTMILPKPLIPVVDQPILEHIMRRLAAGGVRRIDLCLGRHLGGLIETYFTHATSLAPGVEVTYHWEEEPLGTAGALRAIDDLDGPFIAMNGDILTTLDYRELLEAHAASDAALTIAMHREKVDISLGVIECANGCVTGYREKPSLTYDVSMGIYVFEPRALEVLPPEGPFQFPELVERLLEAGERIASFRSDAVWYDIGTTGEYERAIADFNERPEVFAT
jgi:NDP-sugar pyrophosphorylase family protein